MIFFRSEYFQTSRMLIHKKEGHFIHCLHLSKWDKRNVGSISPKQYFRNDFYARFCIFFHLINLIAKLHLEIAFLFPNTQFWTKGATFTFGHSKIFGPDKLRPLVVGHSQNRRIKNFYNICHKSLDQQNI